MKDPLYTLRMSLQSVFHFESMRQGKYTYPPVQQLKNSLDQYNPKQKHTFIELLKAIKEALPYLEKWGVSLNVVKHSMDLLAQQHQMSTLTWNTVLTNPKTHPGFQFNPVHQRRHDDLIPWLSAKTSTNFLQLKPNELTQLLVDFRNIAGFSQKLNHYLIQDPDFLFNLMMSSEENFIKIAKTRLILHLTDQQLAIAIIKHTPLLVHKQKNPFEQIELLVDKLNEILSNGRSVSTLLRNTEAKLILDNSVFFQMFQSEEYQNKESQPYSEIEIPGTKPGL